MATIIQTKTPDHSKDLKSQIGEITIRTNYSNTNLSKGIITIRHKTQILCGLDNQLIEALELSRLIYCRRRATMKIRRKLINK